MMWQKANSNYQAGMAIRVLGMLEELGVIALLAKNSSGLSAREIANRLSLVFSLLEHVCDFVAVNLPNVLRKKGGCYYLGKEIYDQSFWRRLNFLLAYEPIFFRLPELLRGQIKYGKDVKRRGKYLQCSSSIYNTRAFEMIIKILREENPRTIIDIGCGSGDFLVRACSALPGTFGLGIEIDDEVVTIAQNNVREHRLSESIEIVKKDAAKPEEITKILPLKTRPGKIAFVGITIWHEFLIVSEEFLIKLFSRYCLCFPGSAFIVAEYNGFSFDELVEMPQPNRERASFYQLVHPLTGQGLPQPPEKWRIILQKSGFQLRKSMKVEPNLTIYVCE